MLYPYPPLAYQEYPATKTHWRQLIINKLELWGGLHYVINYLGTDYPI